VKGDHAPPKIDKPSITPIKVDVTKASDFADKVRRADVKSLEPEFAVEKRNYRRASLPAGDLIAVVNDRNDLFSIEYRFDFGSRKQPMLCNALTLLERSGKSGMTAEQLQKKLYSLGTSIRTTCGADRASVFVSGIDRKMEESLELLDSWLRTTQIDKSDVKKLVSNLLSERKDQLSDPRFLSGALRSYANLGKQSDYLAVPSNKLLKRATPKSIKKLLSKLPDHQHRTTYFGPRTAKEATTLITWGQKHKKVEPRAPIRYRTHKGTNIYFLDQQTAQSSIAINFPRAPLDTANQASARVYSDYLGGGMGSLIFQEIREARGLAYSATAFYREGRRKGDDSSLMGFMGTQADKTIDALTTMLALLRKPRIQEQRLKTTLASIDQGYRTSRLDPRRTASTVLSWDDRGEPGDPGPRLWKETAKTTLADLATFAMKSTTGHTTISIMGNKKRIDMKALRDIGKIETVPVKKMVGY
jgi:predicted Zn-dependent peptidase